MNSFQYKNITQSISNKPFFQRSENHFFEKKHNPFFKASPIQAKLTVNQSGDVLKKKFLSKTTIIK